MTCAFVVRAICNVPAASPSLSCFFYVVEFVVVVMDALPYFHIQNLKPMQKEVIFHVLAGRDMFGR